MKLFKKEKKPRVKTFFETRKLSFYVSNKDRTPLLSSSGVVYEYECPGCGEAYVGKPTTPYGTERVNMDGARKLALCTNTSEPAKYRVI